jgi:biopolymer transport protein ExbB
MTFNLDMGSFWQQGDAISHAVLLLLVAMSVTSWAIIFSKSVQLAWWQHANSGALDRFWQAHDLDAGVRELSRMLPFRLLVERGSNAIQYYEQHRTGTQSQLDAQLSLTELVTRALRQALNRATADLERGQVFLASIGSVAPFVGLFGTVWGIYHALAVIGATGQSTLDKVAGPVGEALIMTAVGLFVAIPAVLAYNAFNRVQRLIIADLDGFAHDLLMYFTMGSRTQKTAEKT